MANLPRSLNDVFQGAARTNIVHLCVDLQQTYIGEREKPIEGRIGREIAPVLSTLNIPTYWVYYDIPSLHACHVGSYRGQPRTGRGDLSSLIGRREGDLVLPKHETSSMTSPQVEEALKSNGKKALLLSGFSYGVCIKDTANDAANAGYSVVLMTDATDYEPLFDFMQASMEQKGVVFAPSPDVIQSVRNLQP